jgi:tetratricopeptide (TPR) repeat protein
MMALAFGRHPLLALVLVASFTSPSFLQASQTAQTSRASQDPRASKVPRARIDAIELALRTNQFDNAIELSRTALKEFSKDPQLWSLQGVALASSGKDTEARAAFRQALEISPNYIMALQGAAQLEFQAGSPEAAPMLNRLLKLHPNDPISHAMLGVIHYREGNCAEASAHFAKAGSVLDSQPAALHAYAVCLVRLKKLEDAVNVFQRTVTLSVDDPQERRLLAAVQLMARRPNDAVATLDPVLRGGTADAGTWQLAASAYEDTGDTPGAVNALRQAILLEPKNVSLYLDFAHLSYQHQSFPVGVSVLSDGIAQQPSSAQLYVARGVLLVQLGEYEKAEADFDKAHELDPNQSLSAAAQGMAAVQANDLDRALTTVQSKLARKPNDAYLLYLKADILSQKGANPGSSEFRTALASARKSVALAPNLAEARSVLARLYLDSGQTREAIEQCRKAIEINPKDQAALYRLIQALQKTGEKKEIPGLLNRLAAAREQATREERERSRYKLIEGEAPPTGSPNRP